MKQAKIEPVHRSSTWASGQKWGSLRRVGLRVNVDVRRSTYSLARRARIMADSDPDEDVYRIILPTMILLTPVKQMIKGKIMWDRSIDDSALVAAMWLSFLCIVLGTTAFSSSRVGKQKGP